MAKEVLVVKRNILFDNFYFQGFIKKEEYNFIPIILANYEYKERTDELEKNSDYQQIGSYIWIVNPVTKEVFAYKRASKKENYKEDRLMSKWSCGVGGHIDKKDSEGDPIKNVMMRELKEEVKMEKYPEPKIVGFINDDSDDVGKVHVGVVGIVETTEKVEKGDDEMEHGKFYSISEIDKIISEGKAENWTSLSWPFVKNYLINQ